MSNGFEFEGSIEVNEIVEDKRVSVHFVSHCHEVIIRGIGASGQSRKTLFLRPFDPFMLRNSASAVMKAGFDYSISGTEVGSFSEGPYGHPGDGEYDVRSIKRFDLLSRYTAERLTVAIGGTTERGANNRAKSGDPLLSAWKFRVAFFIPRSEMKTFFGLTNSNYEYFEKTLDACR